MGKKKVVKQTADQLFAESEKLEEIRKKTSREAAKTKVVNRVKAYIRSSYNNIAIVLTDERGNVLAWSSSGSLGFRGPKKATPFAASKVVEAITEKVGKLSIGSLEVLVKGIGSGREAAIRSLAARGFDIVSIKDITPIPHNGCRPPKPRRV
ncbi:MAG: 30S ribosomal protein S11 [Candidatus Portnoybacteria bacterium]|nr:30S ribosomal protein S11 [Candidatus Portnoybacteria bacterium]